MQIAVTSNLLNDEAAREYLGLRNKQTLAAWRCANRGPTYIRVGRNIRYRQADLDAFLAANTVTPGTVA